ncbi:MAG: TolC family protein [Candidatus Baltobacteraceae bacterium]
MLSLAFATLLALGSNAEPLSYEDARARLQQSSYRATAAAGLTQARADAADASKTLQRPFVALDASALSFQKSLSLSTEGVGSLVNGALGSLGSLLPELPPGFVPAVSIPSRFDTTVSDSSATAGLVAAVPLYTGGRIGAVRRLLADQAATARTDERSVREDLDVRLTTAYFGLQLALVQAGVADRAADDLARHLRSAQIRRQVGTGNRGLVLQAEAGLAGARTAAAAAHRRVGEAQLALDELLDSSAPVVQTTPLFVNGSGLQPEASYESDALGGASELVRAAQAQTQSSDLEALARAGSRPTAYAFAEYTANPRNANVLQPDWLVGVVAEFTLLDPLDRAKLVDSARAAEASSRAAREAVRSEVRTGVLAAYDRVADALDAFTASGATVAAERETVRSQYERLAQGLATPNDVADARLALAGGEAKRAAAAFDYDLALATLLRLAGRSDGFAAFAQRADTVIR